MNSSTAPRKVAFYIRVSTERQARVEEGSLKNQEQMLRAELERRNAQRPGWGTFVESYVDEGISAKTTNRPAFQRLMRDIELGRINTVLFTELSRLSRSLKDFLNIFEFAQRHACDLVCLKTEIDTTSPYQGLVTKILMVFSEFEREMTSRRTAINAYERSKRGLANGGQTLLGYRRDPQHKGRLLVEETEAEMVRAIFQSYLQERSIRRATEQIKARYQGCVPRLKRITSNMVYRVLTNKAYLGIRAIHKRDKASYEEAPAAWEPVIEEKLFKAAQAILQANKDRYHRRGPQRYLYLLSGLLACGKCGEKLQGKSAYSSHGKRYHYYAHRSTCAKGGRNGIDAEVAQGLVLGWLREIASNGEKFRELQAQGRERLGRQIGELQESLRGLESERAALKDQVELRIQELTRTKAEAVRDSIERSIVDLGQRQKELEDKRLFADHAFRELESIVQNDGDLFTAYSRQIRKVLDTPAESIKTGLQGFIANLLLTDTQINVALPGVPLREPVRAVLVPSPPEGLEPPT
jgi:DNA invertase Pin-like site-specific DNA recombinase